MSDYVLLTDATVDLPQSVLDELDVQVVAMPVRLNGEEYLFEPSQKHLTVADFYRRLRAGEKPETSQVNSEAYLHLFERYAKEGKPVLYLGFSSGLSGTFQSALLGCRVAQKNHPEAKFCLVDTLDASVGEGALVYAAGRLRQGGMGFDELCAWSKAHALCVAHWFTVDDLMFLYRGGRLSKGSAVIGSTLNIKPMLAVDPEGRLQTLEKLRGRNKANRRMIERLLDSVTDPEGVVVIGHGDALSEAEALAESVRGVLPKATIIISEIGPIIGTHVGPGMLAAACVGRDRREYM